MPRFGDLEAAIMGEVWSAEHPVRVRDVLSGINKRRQLAYTTVQTVMACCTERLVVTLQGRTDQRLRSDSESRRLHRRTLRRSAHRDR